MKLVDILARELKVWPQGADSLAQSFGGMVFYISSVVQLKTLFRTEVSEDWREAMVFKPQWQAAVDALKAEVRPTESMALHHQEVGRITRQWNGEGLPPIGIRCERSFGGLERTWKQTTICGHSTDGAYAAYYDGDGLMGWTDDCKLRPIRTPEQIAADRYEEDAAEIAKILSDLKNADEIFIAKTLLDCGYRKFEIVDN